MSDRWLNQGVAAFFGILTGLALAVVAACTTVEPTVPGRYEALGPTESGMVVFDTATGAVTLRPIPGLSS